MKKKYAIIYFAILFALALSSCGILTPKVDSAQETENIPPAPAESLEVVPAPTSETVFINLAGPDIGTRMEWVDGSLMVYIPSGEFIMGQGGEDNPEHDVLLRDFWVYRTKVTNQMYAVCVAAGTCSSPENKVPDYYLNPEYAEQPVVGVNWRQAATYCSWVKGDLPTEAQWEKTARGTEGSIYPWGDSAPNCDLLNFDNCLGGLSNVSDFPEGKSDYDVLDMAGNTFEWVLDWYDPTYYEAAPSDDPYGPELGNVKSVRSSSFESAAQQVPVANRFFLDPEKQREDLGFRCVLIDPVSPAPYCVAASLPTRTPERSTPDCEPVDFSIGNSFCQGGSAYVNIETNSASAFVTSSSDPLNCTQYQAGRLTCGPLATESRVSLTVCAPGCEPDQGATAIVPEIACAVGFLYNPATGGCEYAPLAIDPHGIDCGLGYQSTALGCLPLVNNFGGCGTGQYYDAALGTCLPSGGASDCFPGYSGYPGEETCNTSCLDGYIYDADLGCCAPEDGSYMVPGGGDAPVITTEPSGTESACSSFTVTAASCIDYTGDGEPTGCESYKDEKSCFYADCYWDINAYGGRGGCFPG
ncbi:MAG: SUMF1/EgtB/PvdO family nonheme iron enzyme [Anaerolineae bacterium]|nr:SUMF1/EgtB/PvdO family nonheme iron enzyme [Anaerolineae bacterium]MBT7069298.1 SUMF1/EgtB/PvdO family nonheme iron enzyme [Anaerolineae bacterium]MBT7325986.1 SUMF1/EgtB/PvdO family nonheme iron enzyme [Anaerolineae bacterium]